MRKFLVIMVLVIVVSGSVFAGVENLSVDKENTTLTYVYVKKGVPVIELAKNSRYRYFAKEEFSGALQEIFELEEVHLSRCEFEYQHGRILVRMPVLAFRNLNLM